MFDYPGYSAIKSQLANKTEATGSGRTRIVLTGDEETTPTKPDEKTFQNRTSRIILTGGEDDPKPKPPPVNNNNSMSIEKQILNYDQVCRERQLLDLSVYLSI